MDEGARRLLDRARERNARREEPPPRDQRYVYGGQHAANTLRPARKPARRRVSTFNTLVLLFGGGILIVLYVHNIITINHLAAEVGRLEARYDSVQNTNASLRAEVNRKAAWERIGRTATEQLGLIFPTEQPLKLAVDPEALARAKEQERAGDEPKSRTGRQGDGGAGAEHTIR
jgi:hypothetical protein